MRGGTGLRWGVRLWSPLSRYTVAGWGGGAGLVSGTEMAPLTGCRGVSSVEDEGGAGGTADDDEDDAVGVVWRGVRMTLFP